MIPKANMSWDIADFPIAFGIFLGILVAVFLQFFGALKIVSCLMALTFILLIFRSPFFGLCILILSFPFSGVLQVNRDTLFFDTANKMLAYVIAIAFLYNILKKKSSFLIEMSKSLRWFFLFSIWSMFSLLWTYDQSESISAMIGRFNFMGLAFFVAFIPKGFKQFKTLCLCAASGAAALGGYVAFFGLENVAGEYGKRLAAGTNANVLAHFLAIALILSIIGFKNSGKFEKIFIFLLDLFIIYAIVLTGSRGTWVALIFCGVVAPLFFPGIKFRSKFAFTCIAAFIFGMFYFGLNQNYFGPDVKKAFERVYLISPEYGGGRVTTIWPYYWDRFCENPILGSGLGFRKYQPFSPHSDVFATLVEFGLIGFMFFAILQVVFFRDSIAINDPLICIVAFSLILFLFVAGLTHTTIGLKSYALAVGFFSFLGNYAKRHQLNSG